MFKIDAKWFTNHQFTVANYGQTKKQIIEGYHVTEEELNKSVTEGKPVVVKHSRSVLFFYLKDVHWGQPYYDVVCVHGNTSWATEIGD